MDPADGAGAGTGTDMSPAPVIEAAKGGGASAPGISIEVAFSPAPREVKRWLLRLPAGSTVAAALQACDGLGEVLRQHEARGQGLAVGVWGRKAEADAVLRDGDRLELYRPLIVDPKEARRQRYRKQGEKLPKGIHRSAKRLPPDATKPPGQED